MGKKENPDRERIRFRLSPEELELIDRNANAVGIERNLYVKKMAMHGKIAKLDYKQFDENNQLMKEIKNDINLLIYTILKTNEYFPIDLENINNSLQKIIENQNEILKEFRRQTRRLRNILKENTKEIKVEDNENDNQECF